MQSEFRKLPPQSIEAEMSVLGCILIDNDTINAALEIVVPEDFYRESHRKILLAMMRLSDSREPCDLITMTDILRIYAMKGGKILNLPDELYDIQARSVRDVGLGGAWKWDRGHIEDPYYKSRMADRAQRAGEVGEQAGTFLASLVTEVVRPLLSELQRIAVNTTPRPDARVLSIK